MRKITYLLIGLLFVFSCASAPPDLEKEELLGIRVKLIENPDFIHSEFEIDLDAAFVIVQVKPFSVAEKAGLKYNDLILRVNEEKVLEPYKLRSMIKNNNISFEIWRNGKAVFIDIDKSKYLNE